MFLVGQNQDDHVPLGNGRVLCWLQQYYQARPVDWISQVFYPHYDLSAAVLAEGGITCLAKNAHEAIWYDPYGLVQDGPGQLGEVVSVDETRFVEGTGIYEVISHKGNIVLRTLTWVLPEQDAVVRRFEVKTLKGNPATTTIFPIVHLQNLAYSLAHVYFSRLAHDKWLAVTCTGTTYSGSGDVLRVISGRKVARFVYGSVPTPVVFRVVRETPAGRYSAPAYLVIALGSSKLQAMQELKKVLAKGDAGYQETLASWRKWHALGTIMHTSDPRLNYLWRTSLTLLKTSLQNNGLPLMVGFAPYQGNVWIRDSIWIITTLARTGHLPEALKALRSLRKLLRKRPDGNFYFAYNCSTRLPNEHSHENDSTGLLLYGIWTLFDVTRDLGLLKEFQRLIQTCADWICRNLDHTGMVKPCAGISEAFGPHLGRKYEHMVWTSAISAYGLLQAAEMMHLLGHTRKAAEYRQTGLRLVQTIRNSAVHRKVLCRSRESTGLDASVLHFLLEEMPVLRDKEILAATVKAFRQRLVDPLLGGVWRYEEIITEMGDLRPWLFYTFLLAQGHLELGEIDAAWDLVNQALNYCSYCGLFPELMYSRDLPRGIAMPSFSQCGFLRTMLAHVDCRYRTVKRPPHLKYLCFENLPYQGRLMCAFSKEENHADSHMSGRSVS